MRNNIRMKSPTNINENFQSTKSINTRKKVATIPTNDAVSIAISHPVVSNVTKTIMTNVKRIITQNQLPVITLGACNNCPGEEIFVQFRSMVVYLLLDSFYTILAYIPLFFFFFLQFPFSLRAVRP
jgi:hypothetical protein